MILEAGFIWCKRRGIEYDSDKFVDEVFMKYDFSDGEEREFDNLCSDLRCMDVSRIISHGNSQRKNMKCVLKNSVRNKEYENTKQ